ncbi:MAG TPA: hypothetical protein VLY63_06850 [Anaerolineae bacterium]|nr:hypothetical protein [Anaerolineae bacterium]
MEALPLGHSQAGRRENQAALILTSCALGLLMVFLVYTGNFVFGSEAGKWVYGYRETPVAVPVWNLVVVFGLLAAAVLVGSRTIGTRERTTLLACWLAVLIVQVLIRDLAAVPLASIIESEGPNGFYSAAQRYSPSEILSQFEALLPSQKGHVQSNMPGKIMLFQLLGWLTPSPQLMGYLIIALSSAGSWLVYGISKRLFHDRLAAFYAFLLYAVVPCRLFFLPILNTVTPVFLLACLYLFLVHLQTKRASTLWLLGVALYVLVLFEPSPLVTGIVFASLLGDSMLKKEIRTGELVRLLLITVMAFAVVFLVFRLAFRFDLADALRFVLNDAVKFNLTAQRGYWRWMAENTKEFFYSSGAPAAFLLLYLGLHAMVNGAGLVRSLKTLPIESVVALSLITTFLVLVLLGINRGEVSRLWIYLAVLFQIPVALFISRRRRSSILFLLVVGTTAVQAIVAIQQVVFVLPATPAG